MRRYAVIAVLILAFAALLVPGCASMNKDKIEHRLLALVKNQPVKALGLEKRTAEIRLGGEKLQAEFVYYHAGASGNPPGTTGTRRPTVLLIHGTPSTLFTWTDVVFGSAGTSESGAHDSAAPGLAQDCDVWALEMIGHGMTRTTAPPYTFQRAAEWISAFIDVMDLRDVTIVGNSYGGEFVWRAALDRPDRISKVVLMSSSGFARREGEWLPEEVKMREMSLAKIGYLFNSRDRVRGALQPHFQAPVPPEHVEDVYLVCSNSDNWTSMIDLARDENGTRSSELSKTKQRVLLLWGEKDVAYPIDRFARLFESTIPGARLVIVPNSGHYPQEEAPRFVAQEIRAFAQGD